MEHRTTLIRLGYALGALAVLAIGIFLYIKLDPFAPKQPKVEQSELQVEKQETTEETVNKVNKKLQLPDLDYKQKVDNAGEGWMFTTETFEKDALIDWVEKLQTEGWTLTDSSEEENFYQATLTKRPEGADESKIYVTSGIDESGNESTWVDVRGPEVI